ncbi:MAG TPA: phospho-sugar mutase [Candidatus Bathyarchaeia archaeon]|nr:phospho-sugar mutase [Candidatus Bathyarchaeia archaeon]
MKTGILLNLVKKGFQTIDVPLSYKKAALRFIEKWLTEEEFRPYILQVEYLIKQKKWNLLLDEFYQIIPFGTGGRRGLVGVGPNRINTWTVQSSAQGHSQYLLKQYGQKAKKRGVVLTFDVRKFTQKGIYNDKIPNPVMNLTCKDLAVSAAQVYAANDIQVYLFDDIRSTPQLSFSIRHLKAVAGDMFSASHNPPTDNGKKVYDPSGGQIIPPLDQILVDEVTKNVKEIKKMNFEQAKANGLIKIVGKEIDKLYINEVVSLSLSKNRMAKIVYSPLHGTGLTSFYPSLKQAGFNVLLDPKTKNLSGAFENVTFNIPNPEVEQSFDNSLPFAKKVKADLLINSDPDADRIGLMVRHHNKWHYLNGNEIAIILTEYGITKFREKKKLNKNCVVIRTEVTNSLISKIAKANKVHCIDNLLVGFKYIGDEMNKLEKQGKMDDFIIGVEESHGVIMGNYLRDKDAAGGAIWLSELAGELKVKNKTLLEYLNEIYSKYGYCHDYLTEIRMLGAVGREKILKIQGYLRKNKISKFGDFDVVKKIDRWQGPPQPHLSETDTASRDVLIFKFKDLNNTQGLRVTVRPSGTEPKIKVYFEVVGKPVNLEQLDDNKKMITKIRLDLEKAFMKYCYKIVDVDFPNRGFLLFWQLPLDDKLNYFKIESEIADLKNMSNKKERGKRLKSIISFLGSNPLQKVDKAFKEKYGQPIKKYLE